MLLISLQTLRARRGTLAGAFVAIWLAVTLAYGTGLLMDGALRDPGPGRFAAADHVIHAPDLDASLVRRFEGAVGDISFPVGGGLDAHGWSSAALTPYTLTSGRAPRGPREVVVDDRVRAGKHLRVATRTSAATYRVVGRVHGPAGPATMFFADKVAARLSGAPDKVNAIAIRGASAARTRAVIAALAAERGAAAPADIAAPARLEVLERGRAALADGAEGDRAALVAIFGTMGGIAGAVALFVVAGTFSLAIVQRRREVATLRALGAAPHQIRRLIAGEALLVSLAAGVLGILAGEPLAHAIANALAGRETVPRGFAPGNSWIPLVAALGGGVLIAQAAVYAAARRAGRTRPAEALRDAAVERPRTGILQTLTGLVFLGGGVAMALVFTGMWAIAFAILTGLLLAIGTGLLGRALLGLPAALLARPLRAFGASGLLASTSLAANRWRTAALATPIVLVAMLAGTQAIVQESDQRHIERVTAERTIAPYVATGMPLPTDIKAAGTAHVAPTTIHPEGKLAEEGPWPAAGLIMRGNPTLDLKVVAGSLRDGVGVSRVFADAGDLEPGDTFRARLEHENAPRTLRVGAIYERAAGLGDVILQHAAAPVTTIFATERPENGMTREQYIDGLRAAGNVNAWAVWMIIGLATLFTALALINTAAMATAERKAEFATIRLLGGTRGHLARMLALELAPAVLVALLAGAAIVAASVQGIPHGVTGVPLALPAMLVGGLAAGVAALGLIAYVTGISARSVVPMPRGLSTSRRPPRASTRSASPRNPEP